MPRGIFHDRYLRRYTGGVQVRIVRIGINYSRKFAHRAHGGKVKAEQKARNHRDIVYKALFGEDLSDSSHLLRSRGESQYPPGVSPVLDKDRLVVAYIASWQSDNNETVRKYFAVTELGKDEALRCCIDARVKGVLERIE